MQIMPNDTKSYTFAIFPLQVGYCKLPSFHAKINTASYKSEQSLSMSGTAVTGGASEELNSNLDSIIQNMIPSQIFVFPENIDSLMN
jgi:hypothetical protein